MIHLNGKICFFKKETVQVLYEQPFLLLPIKGSQTVKEQEGVYHMLSVKNNIYNLTLSHIPHQVSVQLAFSEIGKKPCGLNFQGLLFFALSITLLL